MNITIVSKDKRFEYLNSSLNELGYNSKIAEITEIIDTDMLILGVRREYTDSEYNSLIHNCKAKKILSPSYIKNAIDYTNNEVFLKQNAYITAEGAICLYYEIVKESLHSKRALILGYGRIGKYLANMLKNLNCQVYAYARRKEIQKEILIDGYTPVELKNDGYDIVFNTIPEIVTDSEFEKCICIELANGFKTKDKVINGNGLPGKMFPKTASQIILNAILPYIKEMT